MKIIFTSITIAAVGYLITFFVMFSLLMMIELDGLTAALLKAIIGSTYVVGPFVSLPDTALLGLGV